MTHLTVYNMDQPGSPVLRTADFETISRTLADIGVRFERWHSPVAVGPDDSADTILAAYRPYLDTLMGQTGAGSADVVKLTPDHPQAAAIRAKFLAEHTHSEDEIRFFLAGGGNFLLNVGNRIMDVYCTAGDLIGVPANSRHWFDAGAQPSFTALRVFTHPDGWVAQFTGSNLHELFLAA